MINILTLCLIGSDFLVCHDATKQLNPVGCYQNGQYYVFWTNYRLNPIYSLGGARISTSGTVIDPDGKLLCCDSVFDPQVASEGSDLLVVWREGCWTKGDIYGVRVTPDCEISGPAFCISQADNVQWQPDVAYGAGQYMVVWQDGRNNSKEVIYAARVAPAGSVLDPTGIQIGPADTLRQYSPSVAFDGSRFFTVWGYYLQPFRIMGRFIEPNGALGDTIRICAAGSYANVVRLAASDHNFLVVWSEMYGANNRLRGQLVSADGQPVNSPFVVAPQIISTPFGLCFDGLNYCISYCDLSTTNIWSVKYDTAGNPVGAAFKVSDASATQSSCDVIPGANNRYLNVWMEMPGSGFEIKGNLDHEIQLIAEQTADYARNNEPRVDPVIREEIRIEWAWGRKVEVFDVCGARVAKTNHGYIDCRHLRKGVYFIRVSTGESFKVIKI